MGESIGRDEGKQMGGEQKRAFVPLGRAVGDAEPVLARTSGCVCVCACCISCTVPELG